MVTWTNDYKGTRVFNTTIGHNNGTVEDPRYLDIVTRAAYTIVAVVIVVAAVDRLLLRKAATAEPAAAT